MADLRVSAAHRRTRVARGRRSRADWCLELVQLGSSRAHARLRAGTLTHRGDSVMAAYKPYCDGAFQCRATKHLENFVNVIAGSARVAG